MENLPLKVLLVEDDEDDYILIRDLFSKLSGSLGYDLEWVAHYDAALDAIALCRHDVCLLDYRLGVRNGLELLVEAVARGSMIPFIILTGFEDREVDAEALKKGASDYLIKGQISPSLLERSIRYSVERKRVEREIKKYESHLEELVRERTAQLESANVLLQQEIAERKRAEKAIQALFESTVGSIGKDCFDRIVGKICEWLNCECAIVGEIVDGARVHVLSMQVDGELNHDYSCGLAGSPFGHVVEKGFYMHPEGICALFSDNGLFEEFGAVGFVGVSLKNKDDQPCGLICAISRHRLNLPARAREVMDVISSKVCAEIGRERMEKEQKKTEMLLRQAQRMEAIGTLAGGIAHDFNNVLAAIIGSAEMAVLDLPEWNPLRYDLDQILSAGYRARDLVRQILVFSRMRNEQDRQPIEIIPVIKEALKFLRASLPSTIEIRPNISSECGLLLADPTQIHQLLMNLCTNAAHAMQEKGGILEVSLADIDIDTEHYLGVKPGPYLMLTVSDTGQGMDSKTMERIFDPYFTTKEVGKGSGLGLAVVHGILQRHDGAITVYSEPGQGSVFHLYLPRIEGTIAVSPESAASPPGGTERILLVDDEKSLVETGQRMLERLGYHVTSKTSSEEALEVFRSQPRDFDLIITDYTMPHMTGTELAKELMRIRPDIPIVLCTGFSEMVTEEKAKALGIQGFAMKPLSLGSMAGLIRKVIDGC